MEGQQQRDRIRNTCKICAQGSRRLLTRTPWIHVPQAGRVSPPGFRRPNVTCSYFELTSSTCGDMNASFDGLVASLTSLPTASHHLDQHFKLQSGACM